MIKDKVLEGILQSVKFTLEQYMLACFYLSFFQNWLSIVLVILNVQIIRDFHKKLVRITGKNIVADAVELLCVVLVGLILIEFGYFPISNALIHLNLDI